MISIKNTSVIWQRRPLSILGFFNRIFLFFESDQLHFDPNYKPFHFSINQVKPNFHTVKTTIGSMSIFYHS
jgi:hypothetical protein